MNSNKINVRRSFIFTPGLKPEMFPKAISSGADMVCIELEDGIAIKDKDEARKNTFKALETLEVKSGVELVVRVNCQRTKFGLMDLEAVVSSKTNVKAIMLPKVKTPDEIIFIDDMLTDCGFNTDLHVIMETHEALERIYDIAHASKRIVALYFGGVDMAAELRVPNEYNNLIYARSRLVHAGASVGVDVIDVPYLDLEDMDGMKKEAELVRDLGFTGKGSIHPKQINMLKDIPKDALPQSNKQPLLIFTGMKSDRVLPHHSDDLVDLAKLSNIEYTIHQYEDMGHTEILYFYPIEYSLILTEFYQRTLSD